MKDLTKILGIVVLFTTIFSLTTLGCGGSGNTTTGETNETLGLSINSLDGTTDVPIDSKFTYTFAEAVETSTTTENSFFIQKITGGAAKVKAAFDPAVCNIANSLNAAIDCSSDTICTLTPSENLDYGSNYAICLTGTINYHAGDAFEGFMAQFTTETESNSADDGDITLPTYTIGGTVTGLEGTLVLQNNSGDNLTLTESGTFTFSTSHNSGVSYSVSIFSHEGPHACSIYNETGTVSAANVTNVNVVCRGWTHPSIITENISPDGGHAFYPAVAMDNNGNTIVVWKQNDGTNNLIYMSEYRGGSWTHPIDLTDAISPAGQDADYPQVAMSDNGTALVVWYQNNGSNPQIYKSEYRNGSWTHPTDLTDSISLIGNDAIDPQVAMDSSGNAIIVWRQRTGAYFSILKSEYRSGSWTHPADINEKIDAGFFSANSPDVAMDNNGNALIVWDQNDATTDGNAQIYVSEYRDGSWTHPDDASDNISPDGTDALSPLVAMGDGGDAIIHWKQKDGTDTDQRFVSQYTGGIWTHPTDLSDNISIDGQKATKGSIAIDDNGEAVATWSDYFGGSPMNGLYFGEYRGGTWSLPSVKLDYISHGANAYASTSAMDDNGNAMLVWIDIGSPNARVFKSEYRSGIWTHPEDVDDHISLVDESSNKPQVAMSNYGDAIIVWQQSDGTNTQIFISEYR